MDVREKTSNEKRLIDANALLRHKRKMSGADFGGEFWDEAVLASDIKNAHTVDAVEVVHCEKCKHALWDEENEMCKCVKSAEYDEESGEWFGFCEYHNGDFFCSDGEQKGGAN